MSHANAALTPRARLRVAQLVVDNGVPISEVAARFGVSAQVVRQRLRLGAVNAKLMDLYRAGELNLD